MIDVLANRMVNKTIATSNLKHELPPSGWAHVPNKLVQAFGDIDIVNRYGAGKYGAFGFDTQHVETALVTPACNQVVDLLPITVEHRDIIDCTIAEEGEHYKEALASVHQIERHFDLRIKRSANDIPMFLHRLNTMRKKLPIDRHALFNFLCCVVTETRISKELGKHAFDKTLNDWVRRECRKHQKDEDVHHELFCNLAHLAFKSLPKSDRDFMIDWFPTIIIARSTPDVRRYSWLIEQVLNCTPEDAQELASNVYDIDYIKEETISVTRSTIQLLQDLDAINSKARAVLTGYGYSL